MQTDAVPQVLLLCEQQRQIPAHLRSVVNSAFPPVIQSWLHSFFETGAWRRGDQRVELLGHGQTDTGKARQLAAAVRSLTNKADKYGSNCDLGFEQPTLDRCDQLDTIVHTSCVIESVGFGWWPYNKAERLREHHETFELAGLCGKLEKDGKRRTDTNDAFANSKIEEDPERYRMRERKKRLLEEMRADPFTRVNANHFSRLTVDGQGSTSRGSDPTPQHLDSPTLRRQFQMRKLLEALHAQYPGIDPSDIGICARGISRGLSRRDAASTDNAARFTCPYAEFAIDIRLQEGELGFYGCDPRYPNLNRCKVVAGDIEAVLPELRQLWPGAPDTELRRLAFSMVVHEGLPSPAGMQARAPEMVVPEALASSNRFLKAGRPSSSGYSMMPG